MESTEAFEGEPVPAAFPLIHSPYNCKHNPPSITVFFASETFQALERKKKEKGLKNRFM